MKIRCAAMLSMFVLVLSCLAPSPARATTPIDCTQGCYIVTCNDMVCSLWQCDAQGCRLQASWPREVFRGPLSASQGGSPAKSPPAVAHARICPPGARCELYELNALEAVHLGSFDNVDDVPRQRRPVREPGAFQR